MSMINSVRKALAQLRYPKVDADGTLLTGGVAVRTGLLADLLALATAADGEIAVPTDDTGIVIYRGAPAVGVHFPNQQVALSANRVTSTGSVALPTNAGSGNGISVLDSPSLINTPGLSLVDFSMTALVTGISSAGAKVIWCAPSAYNISNASAVLAAPDKYFPIPLGAGVDSLTMDFTWVGAQASLLAAGENGIKFIMWHDGTGTLTISGRTARSISYA